MREVKLLMGSSITSQESHKLTQMVRNSPNLASWRYVKWFRSVRTKNGNHCEECSAPVSRILTLSRIICIESINGAHSGTVGENTCKPL